MKFLDVTIRNYGPFFGQQPSFNLKDRGIVLILGDNQDEPRMNSNGAGKSSLTDAIDWCLYGEVPRGDSSNSVINEIEGKDCEVVVTLVDDEGIPIEISRTRDVKGKHNAPTIYIDGQNHTTQDAKKTQSLIDSVLGMDREVFHSAVMFSQFDKFNFADASDTERKELLTKIIPELAEIDSWAEVAKELHRNKDLRINSLEARSEALSGVLDVNLEDMEKSSKEWEISNADKIVSLKKRLEELNAITLTPVEQPSPFQEEEMPPYNNEKAQGEIRAIEGLIREKMSNLNNCPPYVNDTLQSEIAALQKDLEGLRDLAKDPPLPEEIKTLQEAIALNKENTISYQREAAVLESQINSAREEWKSKKDLIDKGICPTCNAPCDTPESHKTLDLLKNKGVELASKLSKIKESIASTSVTISENEVSLRERLQDVRLKIEKDISSKEKLLTEAQNKYKEEAQTFTAAFQKGIRDEITIYQDSLKSKQDQINLERENLFKEIREKNSKNLEEYNKRLSVFLEYSAKLTGIEQQKDYISKDLQGLASATNPFAEAVEKTKAKLKNQLSEKASIEKELKTLKEEVSYLSFWKAAFSSKGVKSHILDSKVDEITEESNKWVRLLTGDTHWVQFDTQKETGTGSKKKLVDTLNVRVFKFDPAGKIIERNYKSFSGGEKYRISLGIDFAIARLVARRSTKSYNMLVLDEIFQRSLDQSGKEAVADLLQSLSKEFASIFVIDHDSRFQSMFEEVITIRKQGGCSKVVE